MRFYLSLSLSLYISVCFWRRLGKSPASVCGDIRDTSFWAANPAPNQVPRRSIPKSSFSLRTSAKQPTSYYIIHQASGFSAFSTTARIAKPSDGLPSNPHRLRGLACLTAMHDLAHSHVLNTFACFGELRELAPS
uniref:Secreted protein n=1 Tax=Coccidioides posadasii RMSCC 3488 TaxID=454284 RepID=A0A0J6FTT6_COCPO|nr:hypothetical protein CPAG_09087 [Coccidioides posadasii RMSCC 3488]